MSFQKQVTLIPDDVALPEFKINFDVLDSTQVKNLEPFKEVDLGTRDIGRNEPFVPY